MTDRIHKEIVQNFEKISDCCVAIYKGGSRVDPVIEKPHDYDYICFSKPLYRHRILTKLHKLGLRIIGSDSRVQRNKSKGSAHFLVDLSQIRAYPYSKITWFSYLDILMEKVIGDDICPKTDIIVEHRAEFINALKEKTELLSNGTIKNQKRWYHILRGVYILLNNSYEVNETQKKEINILHDLEDGWESVRDKTIQLLNELQQNENLT